MDKPEGHQNEEDQQEGGQPITVEFATSVGMRTLQLCTELERRFEVELAKEEIEKNNEALKNAKATLVSLQSPYYAPKSLMSELRHALEVEQQLLEKDDELKKKLQASIEKYQEASNRLTALNLKEDRALWDSLVQQRGHRPLADPDEANRPGTSRQALMLQQHWSGQPVSNMDGEGNVQPPAQLPSKSGGGSGTPGSSEAGATPGAGCSGAGAGGGAAEGGAQMNKTAQLWAKLAAQAKAQAEDGINASTQDDTHVTCDT